MYNEIKKPNILAEFQREKNKYQKSFKLPLFYHDGEVIVGSYFYVIKDFRDYEKSIYYSRKFARPTSSYWTIELIKYIDLFDFEVLRLRIPLTNKPDEKFKSLRFKAVVKRHKPEKSESFYLDYIQLMNDILINNRTNIENMNKVNRELK